MPLPNAPILITYPDSLGGSLAALDELLRGPLAGLFGGVHILPPYPSSGDRGFAPLTYEEIDPRFGSWADVERIATRHAVALDLMVNHISRRSPEFRDFLRRGRSSPSADLFMTLDKVWPGGEPPPGDVERVFLRRAGDPFTEVTIETTGQRERIWATFGRRDEPEQIDLDVRSAATRRLLTRYLEGFARYGVSLVRLDAIGYVVKKAGTTCFMVEPEIYEFLDWIAGVARSVGLEVLPEVHADAAVQRRLGDHGYPVYDFVLPGLVLHALQTGSSAKLAADLASAPSRQFTMLDCHDGIPIQPDLDGVLTVEEAESVVQAGLAGGANLSRILSSGHLRRPDFDAHQLNSTYFSALGEDEDAYFVARALQLFAPGVPQVYYVGLFAGSNDPAARDAQADGRAINRHDYTTPEVSEALGRPIVRRILELVRLRASHPAFAGSVEVVARGASTIEFRWRAGSAYADLRADLGRREAEISVS